jgi:ATP-dependent Clp protease ATP-binding subunit ClpA
VPDTHDHWLAAIAAARQEAQRARHTFIGTEHLLLGALQQEEADSTRLFASYGLTYQTVARQWTSIIAGTLPLAPIITAAPRPTRTGTNAAGVFLPKAAQALATAAEMAPHGPRLVHLFATLLGEGNATSTAVLISALTSQGKTRDVLHTLERDILALVRRLE